MTLEQAIEQSPDNTAANWGITGWVKVEKKGEEFHVLTEDRPYKANIYTLAELKNALRMYKAEEWHPYEIPFD